MPSPLPTGGRVLAALALTAVAHAQTTNPRPPQELAPLLGGLASTPSLSVTTASTVAAWANYDSGIGQVWSARSNGRGVMWQAPVRVDRDPTFALKLSLSDSVQRVGSNVYVLWIDERNGSNTNEVRFNVSTDGGATFAASDASVPHPLGGAGEIRAVRIASGPTPSGDGLHVAMRVAPPGVFDEELWITSSHDGGTTWTAPLRLAGDTSLGLDVDQFAIAVQGSRVHLVWEDESTNGAGRYSPYHVRSTDHGLTYRPVVRLDTSDAADLGNSDAPGEHGLQVRVWNDQVGVAWVEERTHPMNEEVRVAFSLDGGASFGNDERIGGGDPNVVDVDYLDLWIRGTVALVAFTDNRSTLSNVDQLYVWRRQVAGGAATETTVSTSAGAAFPRFTGTGSQVVVGWLTDSSIRQSLVSRTSEDLGLSWQPVARHFDAQNGLDVDSAVLAFEPSYDNVVSAFLVDTGPGGLNRVHTGGLRPPTLVPQGFSPSAPFISFRGENLLEADATLFLVAVGLTASEGSLVLPDQRDVGLAYDALTAAGFSILPSLVAPIQPTGVANTQSLSNTLPPGLVFRAVGVTVSPTVGTVRLSDVVTIVVN
jgi:hypothetical protein